MSHLSLQSLNSNEAFWSKDATLNSRLLKALRSNRLPHHKQSAAMIDTGNFSAVMYSMLRKYLLSSTSSVASKQVNVSCGQLNGFIVRHASVDYSYCLNASFAKFQLVIPLMTTIIYCRCSLVSSPILPSAKVKNLWSQTFTPPYFVIVGT